MRERDETGRAERRDCGSDQEEDRCSGEEIVETTRETVEEYLSRGGAIKQLPSALPPKKPAPALTAVSAPEKMPKEEGDLPPGWMPPKKGTKFPITPRMHEQIRLAYQTNTDKGAIRALAKRLGLPRWRVTRYAISQCWVMKRKKEPLWTDKEVAIMKKWAYLSPEGIRLKLKAAGYSRTATAIAIKRRTSKARSQISGESASSLAACMGVGKHVILRAIREGKIKAQSGCNRSGRYQTYHIKQKDIRRYLIDYISEVDVRKVDKYWFVDTLTGE